MVIRSDPYDEVAPFHLGNPDDDIRTPNIMLDKIDSCDTDPLS